MRRPTLVLYPLCAAVYPVLALAHKNPQQIVRPGDLFLPLGTGVLFFVLAWLVGRAFSRDVHVRAIVAFLFVLWFSTHGLVRSVFYSDALLVPANTDVVLAASTLIAVVLAAACSAKWRVGRPGVTRYLNISAVILLLFPMTGLLGRVVAVSSKSDPVSQSYAGPVHDTEKPDIYLIVLDKYTGYESLLTNFQFDNAEFEEQLRERGFFVPRSARSNYMQTFLTLSSMLNWTHLDDPDQELSRIEGRRLSNRRIDNNLTARFLKARGYRLVFFPTAYAETAKSDEADLQIPDPQRLRREFVRVWALSTAIRPIVHASCMLRTCKPGTPYVPEPASLIDWKFGQLAQLADSAGPLFVFAHLLVPHEPYIYREDCEHREPYWPPRDDDKFDLIRSSYVEQINCVNRKVLALVDSLIGRSRRPPIILLQSDHGHGRLGIRQPALADAPPDHVRERVDIFAAYYMPGENQPLLYDSITPINVFPLTFNHYFGADIPIQEDATYWSSWARPFLFTRVR